MINDRIKAKQEECESREGLAILRLERDCRMQGLQTAKQKQD